ncbi:uncharacterized protein LOC132026318 [Mustela nigripes]|uniref:uncharacterized protein LOC132026318 n=1 Tax=Mustela nigripes TaxID=77151 RepID=UPI0028159764|nr:uncharacterized protein LOC132026318 [Mustela nigripes]
MLSSVSAGFALYSLLSPGFLAQGPARAGLSQFCNKLYKAFLHLGSIALRWSPTVEFLNEAPSSCFTGSANSYSPVLGTHVPRIRGDERGRFSAEPRVGGPPRWSGGGGGGGRASHWCPTGVPLASHWRPTGVSPSPPAGGRSEHGRSFPASGLIHGNFFPQKTPQGHVRKGSPVVGSPVWGLGFLTTSPQGGSFGSRIFQPNSGAGAPSGAALGSPDPGGLGSAPPRRTPPRRPQSGLTTGAAPGSGRYCPSVWRW